MLKDACIFNIKLPPTQFPERVLILESASNIIRCVAIADLKESSKQFSEKLKLAWQIMMLLGFEESVVMEAYIGVLIG